MVKKIIKWMLIGVGSFFVFIFMIAMCVGGTIEESNSDTNQSKTAETTEKSNSDTNQSEETESTKKDDLVEWKVRESIDEMTDSKNVWKSLESENEVEFSFPYDGGSSLKIEVRYMKASGSNVILRISKGQLLSSFNGTNYVTMRFDDDAPQKFYTNEPADGSSDCLFLQNPQKFIKQAKTAKSIKVKVPVYQEGNPLFTFKVDKPLTWEY